MKVYQNINQYEATEKTIITLGTFDGVHIGHRKIIDRLEESKKSSQEKTLLLTFFPHPRMVLQSNSDIKLLSTIDEKIDLLEKSGLDILVIHPFDKTFSELSAEEFVKQILVDKFNVTKIIIGHDHRFGKNRGAGIDELRVFGEKYNFEVEQISAQTIDEVCVSSTKIRTSLIEGDIKKTNEYLGYPYYFSGKVVHGKKLGRTIGFPTANIEIPESYKLIPKIGVYVVQTIINAKAYYGMMSVGINPTIENNTQDIKIEVNIFDFNQDIYNQNIKVVVLERIRDEEKFDSLEILKQRIAQDRDFSIDFLAKSGYNETTSL